MGKRKKSQPGEVTVRAAARQLAALVRRLPEAEGGRIALTVGGEVRAWLVANAQAEPLFTDQADREELDELAELEALGELDAPPPREDDEPTHKVKRLVKRALKAARE